MQTNLLWKGREYNSLENCLVTTTSSGNEINSTIIGEYKRNVYTLNYHLKTTANWLPFKLNFSSHINNDQFNFNLEKRENNIWFLNNTSTNNFHNCKYVDISVTPFTNTLPINNLQLLSNEEKQIDVIYIDIFQKELKPLKQFYKKLSTEEYLYQNIPNDFEAIIKIDADGFVIDYPYLFERTAITKYN